MADGYASATEHFPMNADETTDHVGGTLVGAPCSRVWPRPRVADTPTTGPTTAGQRRDGDVVAPGPASPPWALA